MLLKRIPFEFFKIFRKFIKLTEICPFLSISLPFASPRCRSFHRGKATRRGCPPNVGILSRAGVRREVLERFRVSPAERNDAYELYLNSSNPTVANQLAISWKTFS